MKIVVFLVIVSAISLSSAAFTGDAAATIKEAGQRFDELNKAVSGVYINFASNSGGQVAIQNLIATLGRLSDFFLQIATQFTTSVNNIDVTGLLTGFAGVLQEINKKMRARFDSATKDQSYAFNGSVGGVRLKTARIYTDIAFIGISLIESFITGKGVTDALNVMASVLIAELDFIHQLDDQFTGCVEGVDIRKFIADQTDSGKEWLSGFQQNAAISAAYDKKQKGGLVKQ